ncbi:hypothetical protein ON010_g19031 [Phytophthora cinnamomi]|nr:hypothetical protein ON010_g19031 [Phytophthora cinnamomi]
MSLLAPTGGASAAAICIRARWPLPGVQDRYIAGDMVVGRYVAGLPSEETGFTMLPPFLSDVDDTIQNAISLCFSSLPARLLRSGIFAGVTCLSP